MANADYESLERFWLTLWVGHIGSAQTSSTMKKRTYLLTAPMFALAGLLSQPSLLLAQAQADPSGPLDRTELETAYPNRESVGVNVTRNPAYSTQFAFKNLMRQARPWEYDLEGGRTPVETIDAFGNLTSLPEGQQVYSVVVSGYWLPEGTYTLEWDGGGMLVPTGEAVAAVERLSRNRYAVELVNDGGVRLEVRSFDPEDPFSDIRFWQPGVVQDESFPFHPKFVEFFEPFGVLRYMDWMGTNGSRMVHWKDRPTAEHQFRYLKRSHGVPMEWILQLANHLQSHPWLCLPHGATDNYVLQTARFVKEHLDPDLEIYLELSNEVWNFGFAQSGYFHRIGVEELGVPENQMPHRAAYAKRAAEMYAIWEDVFDGAERIHRVAGVQASTIETAIRTLSYGDYHESFDVLAIAPYFAYERHQTAAFHERGDVTVDEVLKGLTGVIDYYGSKRIGGHQALAEHFGMRLVAYEAGQHLLDWQRRRDPEPSPLTETFIAANRDPRMKELYHRYMDTFFGEGGDLIVFYSSIIGFDKWGSWGLKEYRDQPIEAAPKAQAVFEAVEDPNTRGRAAE